MNGRCSSTVYSELVCTMNDRSTRGCSHPTFQHTNIYTHIVHCVLDVSSARFQREGHHDLSQHKHTCKHNSHPYNSLW